ncbi:MAG: DNA polymerase III subunit psi [Cytophagaceae bacterium]|nr:DNA polymerase III subunit psi [Cytophagaceae bacterium]
MIEDFYPYIFSEDLYVFPTTGTTMKITPVAEKAVSAPVEKMVAPIEQHVVSKTPQVPPVQQPALTVLHAGQSSALCVVFWGKKSALQTADRDLLNNILKACKLNPADIAFLEADTTNGLLFTDELPASKAIVFCDAEALKTAKQAQLNVYQAKTISGKQLLLSDPLSALAQNTALKANLWKALQALLGIG